MDPDVADGLGLIRIFMTSPEGRQVTIRYGRPSDVLGTALVVGGPLNVNAMTLHGRMTDRPPRATACHRRASFDLPRQVNARRSAAVVTHPRCVLLVQDTGWGKSAVYFIASRLLRDAGAGPTIRRKAKVPCVWS